MSRLLARLLVKSSAVALAALPVCVMAAPATGPISTLGIMGSYNDFKLDDGGDRQDYHLPEAGVFYTFGNKLTGEAGWVYQAGVEAKFGKSDDNKLKEGQADLDLGWRAALDARNFVDVLVGGGYSWTRYEPETDDFDLHLTNKSPFAKAALGYNHQFDNGTLRVELGARRAFNAKTHIKVDGLGSDNVDLKDRTNPYAEVSFLMNQNAAMPVMAGVYYTRTEYKLDQDSDVADNTRLKRNEYGVKVGLAF